MQYADVGKENDSMGEIRGGDICNTFDNKDFLKRRKGLYS